MQEFKIVLAFIKDMCYSIMACDYTCVEKGGPLPRFRSGMNVYSLKGLDYGSGQNSQRAVHETRAS